VYPPVQPTEEFYEILPLVSGELESYQRGRGHDLYAIRDYQFNDSARHVDWKASARPALASSRIRARRRAARDAGVRSLSGPAGDDAETAEQFERAVALCAGLAWHFYEINSVLEFRSAGFATPRRDRGGNHLRRSALPGQRHPAETAAGQKFSRYAGDAPDIFKIVLTSQPRGSIPYAAFGIPRIFFSCRRSETRSMTQWRRLQPVGVRPC
jgi:uncharacterized protein (DUF58 family)